MAMQARSLGWNLSRRAGVERPMLSLALLCSALVAQSPAPERVVALMPFGDVPSEQLEAMSKAIADRVNVTVRIDPTRPLPPEAYYAPRKRWRAEKLLDAIDADPPAGAWKVIGVTAAEISTTKGAILDWGIGGLGSIDGRSCVVSTYLLRKHSRTKAVLLRRLADLAVHEFGHTIGLDHCPTKRCVMRDAFGRLIKSIDSSSGQFCERCRRLVRLGVLKPPP
jgi:archaemetzincin